MIARLLSWLRATPANPGGILTPAEHCHCAEVPAGHLCAPCAAVLDGAA